MATPNCKKHRQNNFCPLVRCANCDNNASCPKGKSVKAVFDKMIAEYLAENAPAKPKAEPKHGKPSGKPTEPPE